MDPILNPPRGFLKRMNLILFILLQPSISLLCMGRFSLYGFEIGKDIVREQLAWEYLVGNNHLFICTMDPRKKATSVHFIYENRRLMHPRNLLRFEAWCACV
jgi:hypothetical protein